MCGNLPAFGLGRVRFGRVRFGAEGSRVVNRSAIKAYLDQDWYRPCRDGRVWLNSSAISVWAELRKRGLSAADWAPLFLNYDALR